MRAGCHCQQYGKSGVPHVRTFRCLVCGALVDVARPFVCPAYRADAAGVCETCAAPAEAHSFAARALGEPLPAGCTEDRCHRCGQLIGIGLPARHLGVCAACAGADSVRH